MIANHKSDHILTMDIIQGVINSSMTKTINIHSSNTNVPGCWWDVAQFKFVLVPAFLQEFTVLIEAHIRVGNEDGIFFTEAKFAEPSAAPVGDWTLNYFPFDSVLNVLIFELPNIFGKAGVIWFCALSDWLFVIAETFFKNLFGCPNHGHL